MAEEIYLLFGISTAVGSRKYILFSVQALIVREGCACVLEEGEKLVSKVRHCQFQLGKIFFALPIIIVGVAKYALLQSKLSKNGRVPSFSFDK